MTRFKAASTLVLAVALTALLVPGAVFAAPTHHARPSAHPQGSVFGTLDSIDANKVVIQTKRAHIKVFLAPGIAYVSYDQASALAGLKVGDQVDAMGRYFDGSLHADRMRYSMSPFVVAAAHFDGTFVSSTPPTTTADGTITIQLKKGADLIVNVDANTRYLANGQPVSTPPSYKVGDRLAIRALQFTDQSWLARWVNDLDATAAS